MIVLQLQEQKEQTGLKDFFFSLGEEDRACLLGCGIVILY